jgi:hypothetical protein
MPRTKPGAFLEPKSKILGPAREKRGSTTMVIRAAPMTVEYMERSRMPPLRPRVAIMKPNSPMTTMLDAR